MVKTLMNINCSKPSITDLEESYVLDAIRKGDIGVGEYIGKFERAWADWNGYAFGVACNSGTNAIYLALKALGIGPGDEVIVPEFTMIATAWAVSYTGATPVFVDCKDDLNIDVDKICITEKTKAIIAVPIYGRAVDPRVYSLGLTVVEDMAEAHGIKPRGKVACYSFYGNKILTTGEGGMCLTNDQELANEMRLYANMYFDKERTLLHPKMGHNFRMTNLQAAVGLAQVERIDEILEKRREIQFLYNAYLEPKYLMPHRDTLWMYDIHTIHQAELKKKFDEAGIETRYGFKPMSMQPMYFNPNYKKLNAYKWSTRILYLPTWTEMTEDDVIKICRTI
jgi:perosamine synthetase